NDEEYATRLRSVSPIPPRISLSVVVRSPTDGWVISIQQTVKEHRHADTPEATSDQWSPPMGLRPSRHALAADAAADQRPQHHARPSRDDRHRRRLARISGHDHHQ